MMMFKLWIILIHLLQYLTVIYTQYVNKEAYTCPYLWMQWKQKRTLGWICGSVSYLQTKVPGVKFENDCCPGYEKIELLDNKCAFIDRSWQPIIDQLRDQKSLQIAQSLSKGNNLQDLSSNSTKNVYTVFVPQQDDDIVSKEIDYVSDTDAVGTMVSSGRWYSKEFHNGQKIPTTKGTNIKVTTYSNGLTFLDCKALLSPDHEASNGLIHRIDGALPPTYKYPTVLKRLNAESDLTAFVQSLPQDIKRKLDEPDSIEWYTVFAVPNNIWNKITSGIVSTEIKESLARQHVMNKMICSDAIVKNTKRVGPTLAETYIGIQRNSNGNLIINDICNKQIAIQRKDLMSGTGVIHIIENSISSLESMKLNEALECLENNPSLGVKQAANEMRKCQMNLGTGRDNVILLSNDGAFQSKFYKENMRQLQLDKCKLYLHHLLQIKNPQNIDAYKTGFNQEQEFTTQYSTLDGSKHSVYSRYIKTRHGTKLTFNHAEATDLHPIKFHDGVIHIVKQVNLPPQGDISSLIQQKSDTKEIFTKFISTNFRQQLSQHSPNVLFLAPIDLGWKTRNLENSYSVEQNRKLLQLHTIPHGFFGSDDGFIERGSVLEVESLLTDLQGKKVKLLIKRTPDGNTFVGHKDLKEELWSMVIDWNKVGGDGILWFIDWPMKCPEQLC
uniref:Transforming growth factor-beta-induced protein ig-h3 n=1 Tax=Schistosoma mansoni TaxID=6183 RepID=A0A3Q0KT37_SCHMA